MDKLKKEKLQKKGWIVGDVDEFLGLSPAEMVIVEMKVALAKHKFQLQLLPKQASLGMPRSNMLIRAFRWN